MQEMEMVILGLEVDLILVQHRITEAHGSL